jgi:multisubunit Na+/H+ antiporter MnhB subunit
MLINTLLIAHIAVLGYWLASDLVINSTFRYVSRAASMPCNERARLLDHVMDIDQHVRYALVLQVGLGTALAALLGYLPGGGLLAGLAGAGAFVWLVLVELTHRLRRRPIGKALGRIDRSMRYLAIVVALALAGVGLSGYLQLPGWLAVKLALFAGAIISGLGIRFELVRYFKVWDQIAGGGSTAARETLLRRRYASATAVLIVLWLFIAGIVALSTWRPA